MSFVRLANVSFSYCDPIDVLTGVTLDLHAGWTGVVGENGSGKSTLLGLVAGELVPTSGTVTIEPPDACVHVCRQRTGELEAALRALGDSWSKQAVRLRARLRLEPEELERWPTLSPGERKRWQIGAALAASPEVLLLDEPTNHLDGHARALLVDALARYRGVGLVVSHDRALLEALTTQTVRVHRGRVSLHRGAYGQARDEWRAAEQALAEAHAAERRTEKTLLRRLADERRARAAAEARTSSRRRMKSIRDSDARSSAAKARARSGEARIARSVGNLRRAVDRAGERLSRFEMARDRGGALFVDYQPARKRVLMALDVNRPLCTPGGQPVVCAPGLAVERDSRVHVAGRNGAGKTTLLRALMASADGTDAGRERMLYLPQSLTADERWAIMDGIRSLPPDARGRVLQVAAALGLDPERVLATSTPSPGETRKLAIARGLGAGVWALILDEPTNHLDLPSIERLQDALAAYPGALVLVSHDEPFARSLTNTTWHVGE